jgi:hypothetical protein
LWWVDIVVYALFGILLATMTSARIPIIFAAGACVGTIDGSIGMSLAYWIRIDKPATGFAESLLVNYWLYPTFAAIITALGALAAMFFRRREQEN